MICSAASCNLLGGNSDGPTAPSGPLPAGSTVVYAAVGASDVTGVGSSSPCLSLFGDCPNSTGYVFVAARQLRAQGYTVTVSNLGIPTAVLSRRVQSLTNESGQALANITEQLVPFIPTNATLVTIFIGANDVNVITGALGRGAGGSNPVAFIDEQIRLFGEEYAAVITAVRRRAPSARLVVLNLPNIGALPFLAAASLSQKQAAQRISVGITTRAINTQATMNVRVVDLMCDARFYQNATYSADGFHPNDTGYGFFASEVVRASTSTTFPAPQASCPQMTLIP